jgi:hypothetical protein
MLGIYLAHPRPVLWRGMFEQRPGETRDSALSRCYRSLLAAREALYRKLADVTIDYHVQKAPGFRLEDLLGAIREGRCTLGTTAGHRSNRRVNAAYGAAPSGSGAEK